MFSASVGRAYRPRQCWRSAISEIKWPNKTSMADSLLLRQRLVFAARPRRVGRPRCRVSDERYWLFMRGEFQPSAWSKGSYLNVRPSWLWLRYGGNDHHPRPTDFISSKTRRSSRRSSIIWPRLLHGLYCQCAPGFGGLKTSTASSPNASRRTVSLFTARR